MPLTHRSLLPLKTIFASDRSDDSMDSRTTGVRATRIQRKSFFHSVKVQSALQKRIIFLIFLAIFFHHSISALLISFVNGLVHSVTLFLFSHTPNTPDNALWRASVVDPLPITHQDYTIDVVVSHCDLPIDWIFEWAYPYNLRNVTVFSKCNQPVVGAPSFVNVTILQNVGRCDHTYAYYMAYVYDHSESNNNHTVLFLKDDENKRRDVYARRRSLSEMLQATEEYGFSCHEDRIWQWSQQNSLWHILQHPVCQISSYHNWTSLRTKDMKSYTRLKRDRTDQSLFTSENGLLLGKYADQMGIEVPPIVPVCYGGNFMTIGKQIQNHSSRKLWERMEQSLSRASNVAEGHFVERLWAALLSYPLKEDQIESLLQQSIQRCYANKNFQGVLGKYRF